MSEEKIVKMEDELDEISWIDLVRRGERLETLKSGQTLYHVGEELAAIGRIGFLINKKLMESVVTIEKISSRPDINLKLLRFLYQLPTTAMRR